MSNMNAEQLITKSMLKLRILRPFYSAVFESMNKKESDIPTMGVDANTVYYNKEYIENLEFSEFMFIVLHEIGHIALQHVARRENRDRNLWNIACDLYVNNALLQEYGLRINEVNENCGVDIKPKKEGLYCTSVDLDKDCVESIFNEFDKQAKDNGYYAGKLATFKYIGSNLTNSFKNKGYTTFKITTHMDEMNLVYSDLIEDGSEQSSKLQKSNKIISDALVRISMQSNLAGTDGGLLKRLVENLIKSEVDWKKLLRKYLIQATSSDTSFNNPDKRMYYQKMIYSGQSSDYKDSVDGLKVCIDTSGSINSDDLSAFFYQVKALSNKFNINAELIYWDAVIQSQGKFESYKQFNRIACSGQGGTQPKVLFDYFDKKKLKPAVVVIFTDGYFDLNWVTPKHRKKYKDTIWVMTKEHNKNFEVPFGKKAIAKF